MCINRCKKVITSGEFNLNILKAIIKGVKLIVPRSLGNDNIMEIIKLTFDE